MVYTVTDIKEKLGIGMNSAYKLVHRADFPSVRIGRKIVIPKDDFHKWLEKQAQSNKAV